MLITDFGCSPQVKGFEGRPSYTMLVKKDNNLAMILITDFKLDPLSVDDRGNTPLHMYCPICYKCLLGNNDRLWVDYCCIAILTHDIV